MGDAPIAYVEGAGGTRVAEEQIVAAGKNDVSVPRIFRLILGLLNCCRFCPSRSDDSTRHSKTIAKLMQYLHECTVMTACSNDIFRPWFQLSIFQLSSFQIRPGFSTTLPTPLIIHSNHRLRRLRLVLLRLLVVCTSLFGNPKRLAVTLILLPHSLM